MIQPKHNILRNLLMLVFILTLCGCSTTERDWKVAQKQGNIEAYELFLEAHPNAEQASKAKSQMIELKIQAEWDKVTSVDSIAAYSDFLKKFPQSSQAEQARIQQKQLEAKRDWEQANSTGTLTSYTEFMQKYPKSKLASKAKGSINRLKEEHEWNRVVEVNTRDTFTDFLKKFPSSSHCGDAKQHLIELSLQEAVDTGTFDALDSFIKEYFGTAQANKAFDILKNGCKPMATGKVLPWSSLSNVYAGTTEQEKEVWYGIDLNSFIYPPISIADKSLMVGAMRFYRPSNAAVLYFRNWSSFDGYVARGLASVTEDGLVFKANFTPPSFYELRTKPEVLKWKNKRRD